MSVRESGGGSYRKSQRTSSDGQSTNDDVQRSRGSLQEGIALAVSQAKAVVCFVRDDEQLSATWENEYFAGDDELAQLLDAKAVTLKLAQGSQEAGFLASFCPIAKTPAVVVIQNGMLREYIVPEISKEDLHSRLRAVFDGSKQPGQVDSSQSPQTETGSSATAGAQAPIPSVTPTPTAPPQPQPEARPATNTPLTTGEPSRPVNNARQPKPQQKEEKPVRTSSHTPQKEEERKITQSKKPEKKTVQERKNTPKSSKTEKVDDTESRPKIPPGPPTQYRLQVRLFDGSSVRSSFAPSQSIGQDVRPWLDQQMAESRPYNLKHILTPLPNRNLTIADEEQTLQAFLGLSATANLVMVPIQTYTEAYSSGGSSLPVRAVSAAYDMATSAVGSATGLVGSLFGYGQTTPTTAGSSSSMTSTEPRGQAPGRPAASRGPIIRTLADQRREQGDSQLYNGNQLNFEPRGNGNQR